ncbi:MAG: hypothetical protein HYZ15_11415 [Sphingobacteriales bacterium]|nr:hypothetical protein [Sphingobacteriales bacterium]
MKKLIALLLVFTAFLFQSCLKDQIRYTYTMAIPVYKSKTEVYANIRSNTPLPVESPGKLFITGNYIFLNEVDKGVHIIDNSNPAHPVLKAFINIPGNLDIAVKGNTLFADLYTDLVVVDITNPLAARFIKYIPQVFPGRDFGGGFVADSSRVIVDWIRKDTTVDYSTYLSWDRKDVMLYASSGTGGMQNNTNGGNPNGIAGSMARFSIVDNYMYCLNSWQLRTYSLSNPLDPQQASVVNMPWNIETLYPFRNKLFIGSSSGMFIYDISNPAVPVQEGQFQHVTACDPVITDGSYAYVTLRDGSTCSGSASNQLDVLDVTNMSSPFLLHSYTMTNPHGLSKSGDLLFICDGRDGLKIYDAASPGNLRLKEHITGLETYDAIAWNNNLIVVAKDGLYQYDYSNPVSLTLRSKISVNRKK